MEGEIQQPVPIPEPEQLPPEQTAQQPDMIIAPANPADSETRLGVTDRLAQFREHAETLPESRPRIADLEAKFYDPLPEYLRTKEAVAWRELQSENSWFNKPWSIEGKDFTKEEAFYLEHGWKAYLQEYPNGYSIEDIARVSKLAAGDIKNAIADGTIKDPKALRLYGQMKLDSGKQYYTKWALNHIDDEWVQKQAKEAIELTEKECLPLIHGTTQDLLNYSNQEGAYQAANAEYTPADDDQRLTWQEEALNWYAMAAKLAEQRVKQEDTPETKVIENVAQIRLNKAKADLETMKEKQARETSSQASEVPSQPEAISSEQPATPEQQQFQELQKQFDQLKVVNKTLVTENTALRGTLTQVRTELEELRAAIEGDEAIDPKKKEHLLIRIVKAIGVATALIVVGTTNTVEDNLEK